MTPKVSLCETVIDMRDLEDPSSGDTTRYDDLAEHLLRLPDTPDFARAQQYFEAYPERSLIRGAGRAFLYQLVRSLRPEIVLEVGTYAAGTAEVLARALWANDRGGLLTIDPFGKDRAPPILAAWPRPLQDRVMFHPMTSMDCFQHLAELQTELDIVFIDGQHEYGFALYDLVMAANRLRPGGVIVMDNSEQPGVFWSAKHFARLNPGWHVLGDVFARHDEGDPFQTMSSSLPGMDFVVLLAPEHIEITETPVSFDCGRLQELAVEGFHLDPLAGNKEGILHIQIFLRTFPFDERDGVPIQHMELMAVPIEANQGACFIAIDPPEEPTDLDPARSYRRCEVVLAWKPTDGPEPLRLSSKPALIKAVGHIEHRASKCLHAAGN